jgi:hypothetical protein
MVTPPNFVLLDSTLPDVVRLVTAMVTDRFPLVVEALARLRSRYCIIVGLGGAAAWPLAAGAQQPGKLRTIGFPGSERAFGRKRMGPLWRSDCATSRPSP